MSGQGIVLRLDMEIEPMISPASLLSSLRNTGCHNPSGAADFVQSFCLGPPSRFLLRTSSGVLMPTRVMPPSSPPSSL
nr:hypothetical protein CFP56_77822 [Quercus suber]